MKEGPLFLPGEPLPKGHYAPGFVAGGFVYVSGQLPWGAADVPSDRTTANQVRICLAKLEAVLKEAGCSRADVVKVTGYITDIAQWGEFNAAYAEFFGEHRPARVVIPCGPLNYGCHVEIDCVARIGLASQE